VFTAWCLSTGTTLPYFYRTGYDTRETITFTKRSEVHYGFFDVIFKVNCAELICLFLMS
jgi:hypothetical protein